MAHGVHRISREHAAPGEQTTELPVRQSELRGVERVLAVDPAGEPVAHEWRVDGGVEAPLLVAVVTDERRHEPRTVAVEQGDRVIDGVGDDERDLW